MSSRSERNEQWKSFYNGEFLPWHITGVNFNLKNHFDTLVAHDGDIKGKRILVPLCGKSVDLVFFYEKGLTVVGVEVSDIAIQSFAKENNIPLSTKQIDGFTVHSNQDGCLSIYQGDLFECTPDKLGGAFHYWWDCGSMTAIANDEIQKYMNLIFSLTVERGKGLLSIFDYAEGIVEGPPDSIPQEKVEKLCEGQCKVTLLCRIPENEVPEEHTAKMGNDNVFHALYLMEK